MTSALERALNSPKAREMASGVVQAVIRAAEKPNPMSVDAVAASASDIKTELAKEIAGDPALQHVANAEKWWQKRSRWSAIIATASAMVNQFAPIFGYDQPISAEVQTTVGDVIAAGLALWAAILALWAGLAKYPLFSRFTSAK